MSVVMKGLGGIPVKRPTERQLEAISIIEENLDVEFLGCTFDAAHEFISQYMEESKRVSEERRTEDWEDEFWDEIGRWGTGDY